MTRPALEHQLWPALRRYWHPVAYAAEVGAGPAAVQLLGERLVVVRLGTEVACFRDLCVHRATALSLGRVEERELVCAYHGWRFAADGACVHIPALPPGRAIPAGARLERFACEERYGLVWVCLADDPVVAIPEYAEFADPGYTAAFVPAQQWRASAARATENAVDAAHFPWLHEGILGSRDHPEVPVFAIEQVGEELRYRFTDLPNPMHPEPHERVYRLHRPFSIHQRKERASGEVEAVLITSCPRAAQESTVFLVICRNFHLGDAELDERMATDVLIMEQDRPVVESQRPAELPLDLAAELHLRGPDAVAVAYRRFMAEVGVDIDAGPVAVH
jgi:phenylpropionate dioxygenase-like ring-hydroxylating dioxygenase large terminal subunit